MATNPQDEFSVTGSDQAAPSGVGQILRAARERTGKDVAEVAILLRIRQPFLQALEEGRHRDLPGGTYAIGFLRTYADFLELDGEEMVRRFKQEASDDLHPRSELVFPSPVSEGRIPNGALLVIGLVLAGAAYGGWYWLNSHNTTVAGTSTALPERLMSEFSRPASLTADKAASAKPDEAGQAKPDDGQAKPAADAAKSAEAPAPAPAADQAKAEDRGPEDKVAGNVAPPAAAESGAAKPIPAPADAAKPAEPATPEVAPAGAAEPEPAKPDAGKPADAAKPADAPKAEPAKVTQAPPPAAPTAASPAPADGGGSRVVIRAAADDCWIQVREMDGQLLASKLLHRGEAFSVPNRPGLTLTAGNAGALAISVDGKTLPPLCAIGQVRRDISLDPAKLPPAP